MSVVTLGIEYFPDPSKGRPVFNGYLYIGIPDTDPEVPANQKIVAVHQEDGLTIPAAQPIRTSSGGVPVYNGAPVQVVVDGDYSLKILNEHREQIYYVASAVSVTVIPAGYLQVTEEQELASGQIEVIFDNPPDFATFYVGGGTGADRGRLIEGNDYTLNTITRTVTLADSYPAGTILTAVYNDVNQTVSDTLQPYDTLEDLRNGAIIDNTSAYLKGREAPGDGGNGVFVFDAFDLSAEVTADPQSENYVAPTSDLTGASGAWVRQPWGTGGVFRYLATDIVVDPLPFGTRLSGLDNTTQKALETLDKSGTNFEVKTLVSGQTTVTFTNPLLLPFFTLVGDDCDSGQLVPEIDYTVDLNNNQIILAQSYPAGTSVVYRY